MGGHSWLVKQMLFVKTKLDRSDIDGIGLFADEYIPKGTVVWQYDPMIDIRFSDNDISRLSPAASEQVLKYSYRDKGSGLYVLCGDDARFFNHSNHPNCFDIDELTIASRDISKGEEMTCDYRLFDLDLIEGKYRLPDNTVSPIHNACLQTDKRREPYSVDSQPSGRRFSRLSQEPQRPLGLF